MVEIKTSKITLTELKIMPQSVKCVEEVHVLLVLSNISLCIQPFFKNKISLPFNLYLRSL